MTYINMLETLANSHNIHHTWNRLVRPEDKIQAAHALIKFIKENHMIDYCVDFTDIRYPKPVYHFIHTRKYGQRIKRDAGIRLYDFLFRPTQVTKTYAYQ